MLTIMNSTTGTILGSIPLSYNPRQIDSLRTLINKEYGFKYSLVWMNK